MTIAKKNSFIGFILVMVMALCFAFAAEVEAAPVAYTGQTAQGDYTISTAAQLAELAAKVNASPGTDYSGSFFTLTNNIDLANSDSYGSLSWTGGTAWTPIGGACLIAGGVPTGKYFAGIFDGQNYKISNISITSATSGYGAYGLFGFVNGGALVNLSTAGAISIGTPVISVGGIVGYIYGAIDNCHNAVSITLTDNTSTTSMCGGIAGCVENTTGTSFVLQRSSNTANIQGRGRVGGIAGAVYCTSAGGVEVNRCKNSGIITTTSNTNTYSAGIVGYCRGHIDNCYNTGDIVATDDGHYIAGIVGLLQDSNPQARLQYCYSTGTVTDVGAGYCQALFAKADNSTTMPINNCFWLDTLAVGQSTGSGWGNCVNVAAATAAQLKGTAVYSGSDYVLDYLNNFVSSGEVYSQPSNDYPILVCESMTEPVPIPQGYTPGSVGEDTDNQSMIFLDGTASTDGSGSKTSPYNNMTSAMNAVTSDRNIIYITGQVTLSSAAGTWSAPAGISSLTIKRSSTYSGYLVEVAEGGSLTLEDIIIDGNKWTSSNNEGIITACNALFNVTRSTYNGTAGSLTIGSGAVLQNSYANSGAAVRIYGANATLKGGTLTGNDALTNGGAVAVYRWIPGPSGGSRDDNDDRRAEKEFRPGSFTLSSGTISGNNAANYGGAVYLGMSQNSITINGGAIGGASSATANNAVCGGGVYMERNTSFTMTDGVIDSNTATTGPGVFLNSDGTLMPTFTVSPLSSSFKIGDVIYLKDNAKISVTATLANLATNLTVQCTNPVAGTTVVATCSNPAMAAQSYGKFSYADNPNATFAYSGMNIRIQTLP